MLLLCASGLGGKKGTVSSSREETLGKRVKEWVTQASGGNLAIVEEGGGVGEEGEEFR